MKKYNIITCECCGFSFDKRLKNKHECDQLVLENRAKEEAQYYRDENDRLEAGEMRLSDF